jgi:signal transduction histidine kinase
LVETLVRTYTPKAKSKGLLLTVDIDDKLPDMLFADDVRLRQVMAIILDNAVKFTHSGNICIALQPAEETPPSESDKVSLFCSVSDTGVGIKPDQVDKIFEGFTQADGSFTRKHEGAGLGLAIARQTIRSMGGTLWVESSPGSGSAFLFRVPSGEKEA